MKGTLYQRTISRRGEFAQFRERTARAYALHRQPARIFVRSFYDTADWRLFRCGRTLERDEGAVRLRELGDSARYVEQSMDAVPRFGREFPEGPLGGAVGPMIGIRALLSLGEIRVRVSPYEVRDRDGKILAYIEQEQLDPEGPARADAAAPEAIRIRPLRGYEKVGRRLAADLDQALGATPVSPDPWFRLLSLKGKTPGDYSTRLRVQLVPGMAARPALARILLLLLDAMLQTLDQIRADVDPEFLHDFRVACRRSRTLITQVRGVLAAQGIQPFKEAFAWLSAATSARRDLDVFLWDFPRYRGMLGGAADAAALDPVQQLLASQRRESHGALLATLESDRFTRFVREWRLYLESTAGGEAAPGDAGADTATDCANRTIQRLVRRLLRQGQSLEPGYSENLHELRKTGKKLRYVMEAFSSLYAEDDIEKLIKSLRRLQNVMGRIVDFHVQQDILRQWREDLAGSCDAHAPVFAALDRLGAGFHDMELKAGEEYAGCFARFAEAAAPRRMKALLGGCG